MKIHVQELEILVQQVHAIFLYMQLLISKHASSKIYTSVYIRHVIHLRNSIAHGVDRQTVKIHVQELEIPVQQVQAIFLYMQLLISTHVSSKAYPSVYIRHVIYLRDSIS